MRSKGISGLLFFLVFVFYSPTLNFDFVCLDDEVNIYHNPNFSPPTWHSVQRFWDEPYANLYCPLTYTVWAGLAPFSRKINEGLENKVYWDPKVYHLANVLVFAASAVLVFAILSLFFKSWPSFIGALFFALHPTQAESVAWITSMKGLLSGFLALFSIFFYLKFKKSNNSRPVFYWLGLFSFLLSLFSKSTFLLLPGFLFLMALFVFKENKKVAFLESVPAWIFSFIFLAIGILVYEKSPMVPHQTLVERVLVALDSFTHYFFKVLYPVSLAFDDGRTVGVTLSSKYLGLRILLLPFLSLLVWWGYQKKGLVWPLLGFALFVLGLFPVLGWIPHDMQAFCTTSDRYLSLSLMAFSFFLAWVISAWGHQIKYAVLLLFIPMSHLCFKQVKTWENCFVLNSHTYRINPGSAMANVQLGYAFQKEKKWDLAVKHFQKALEVEPHEKVYEDLVKILLFQKSDFEGAISVLNNAVLYKKDPTFFYHLGLAWKLKGNEKVAKEFFEKSTAHQIN